MSEVDVRGELRGSELPSLYLRATRDRVVAAAFGEQYLGTARQGRLIDFDAPHFLLQARPRDAAGAILEFLHRV
jgi:pimeloyl-ACP methyl ester carboxylesterase